MEFFVTSDAHWEAKLEKITESLNKFDMYFYKQNYGASIDVLSIILMCRNPEYNFKPRIRFSKKENKLSTDIMLNLDQFRVIDQTAKEKIVAQKFLIEIPAIIANYKFKDFDVQRFEADLNKIMKILKWI